jgi:hypothetical protein
MSGSTVTIPGVSGSTLSLPFVGSANIGLAQQISNALAAASASSHLDVVNYTGGALPVVPGGDTILELVLSSSVSGSITVPAAASGVSEVLIVSNTQALTIHGSGSLSIIGGGPGSLDIIDPGIIDVGAGIGPTGMVSMTFTSADSPYQVAMGQGFETVNGQGTGTITGGTGPDAINTSGTGPNVIFVPGPNATISAGSTGGDTVTATGFAASIDGAAGTLTVNDQGYLDTITGPDTAAAAVTTGGFRADVTGGSTAGATLTEIDTGLSNTIQAGAGATNVTLKGTSGRTRGGTGAFTVDDLTAGNTIIGATSSLTTVTIGAAATGTDLFGRSGNTSILDLASGALIGPGGGANSAVTIGGANSAVYGEGTGGGDFTASIGAANAIVAIGSANATVDGTSSLASGALVFGGFSNTAANDGNLVFNGGADQVFVITGGSNATVNAGTGTTYTYLGTGVIGSSNNLINGGSGALDVTFIGGAGSATVFGGTGAASLFGADGADMNFTGDTASGAPGGFLFAAGTSVGGETLNAAASTTNDTLNASAGNDSLIAGSGKDILVAGANTGSLGGAGTVTGGDAMVAGSGVDTLEFVKGVWTGAAVVTNFSSPDIALLAGYGSGAAAAALASATVTGSGPTSDTTIALSDGTHITFVDQTVQSLTGHILSF